MIRQCKSCLNINFTNHLESIYHKKQLEIEKIKCLDEDKLGDF